MKALFEAGQTQKRQKDRDKMGKLLMIITIYIYINFFAYCFLYQSIINNLFYVKAKSIPFTFFGSDFDKE